MSHSLDPAQEQLNHLAAYLFQRREAILEAWHESVSADPSLGLTSCLTLVQFQDHIPQVLDYLNQKLKTHVEGSGVECETINDRTNRQINKQINKQIIDAKSLFQNPERSKQSMCDHGLHRWQQGYNLHQVIHEWGHLHLTLVKELNQYELIYPATEFAVMMQARLILAQWFNDGVSESIMQYDHFRQVEAAGHVHELEQALEVVKALEQQRGEVLRVASHDLRGSLNLVKGATALLNNANTTEQRRTRLLDILHHGVASLQVMLNELMDLARLEAGHEQRRIESYDAAHLLQELCRTCQPLADERGLFLHATGAETLPVEGDPMKTQRIAQNLVLNALKYTKTGGVTISWAEYDEKHWMFSVQDTGPGLQDRSGVSVVQELQDATQKAKKEVAKRGASASVFPKFPTFPSISPSSISTSSTSPIAPISTPSTASADWEELSSSEQPPNGHQTCHGNPTSPNHQTRETSPVHSSKQHLQLVAGEGIGLSIVKRLCELLDASIQLESKENLGSLFQVILPRTY